MLDPEKDYYNYVHVNNRKARKQVLELIESQTVVVTFREIYPNKTQFTWRTRTPFKQGRLDFFLISEHLMNLLEDSNIEPSYRSGHSMINLRLIIQKNLT